MTTGKRALRNRMATAIPAVGSRHPVRTRKDKIHDRLAADLPINAVVAPAVVDDPLELGAKLKVLRSERDDPLAGLRSRGVIGEDLYAAGRRWQAYHEAATVGSVTALDPTRTVVDGGKIPEPITDRQIRAIRALAAADATLGARDQALIRDVLGDRLSMAEVARKRSWPGARGINYAGRRFRDALDTLAMLWGYRTM
jgi:hypothetical protein